MRNRLRGKSAASREDDATLTFPVHDPKIDRFNFMMGGLQLKALKGYLSEYRMKQNDGKIVLGNFINNLCGIIPYQGHIGFIVARTRSSIFALSHDQQFSGKLTVLEKDDELLFIRRITSKQLARLMPSAKKYDSLVPDEDNVASVDVKSLGKKLKDGKPFEGAFDLKDFAARMRSAHVFKDGEDRIHYVIDSGEELAYVLYVDSVPPSGSKAVLRFRYQQDTCVLCVEDVLHSLREKLEMGEPFEGAFDLKDFAARIRSAQIFKDGDDRMHYVIDSGEEFAYVLYMGSAPPFGSKPVLRFRYEEDICVLCEEDVLR